MISRLRALGGSLVFLGGGFALSLLAIRWVGPALRPLLTGGMFSSAVLQTAVLLLVFALLT